MLVDRHVNWMIETLSDKCGLYNLAVDMYAFGAKYDSYKERTDLGKLPFRFVKDVLIRKIEAEAETANTKVSEAFSCAFIAEKTEQYHGFHRLDLVEATLHEDLSDLSSTDYRTVDSGDEEGLVPDLQVEETVRAELALRSDDEGVNSDGDATTEEDDSVTGDS